MNGARTIFRRKGYLLTALAAAVLLAASSGTAWAQDQLVDESVTVTLSAARSVGEGGDVVITVRGEAMVEPTSEQDDGDVAAERAVTVDVALTGGAATTTATMGEFAVAGHANDAGIVSNPRVILSFAENTGSAPRARTATGTVTVRTNQDPDAEDERVTATGMVDNAAVDTASFTITDDETQAYILTLNTVHHTSTNPPKEAEAIEFNLEAKPAHYQGGETLTLQIDGPRGYAATGDDQTATMPVSSVSIGTDDPNGLTPLVDNDGDPAPVNKRGITIMQSHSATNGDGNRVTDMLTLEAYAGAAGRDSLEASMDIEVLDIHMLPGADAITAVAGLDPVWWTSSERGIRCRP